ncbi:MAG: YfhO family protein [Lachnospiraceae bacterium]|nr:YfhO family protein [Lachnospiraceae bacterium]
MEMKRHNLNLDRFFLFMAAVAMAAVFLLVRKAELFGSGVDWISQHSVLPDYFRQLFYKTGEIYPDFSMQLGGGQNIFNFAYYGLLNPCIMLSWLFPRIPMDLWIMGLSLISFIASVLLFHYWLVSRKLERTICFFSGLMFMLAAPLFYHSCVQVMFVNYMPFLCMGLIGTDRYFEKRKAGLVCISILLMILTSFYFSIGSIVCLCLYALYCYLKISRENEVNITVGSITGAALKYMSIIFTAVFLSCFYLVPTAAALLGGRGTDDQKPVVDLLSLFLPLGKPGRILYGKYGMGLSCIAIIAVLAGMFRKKIEERVLSIGLFFITAFPICSYALNGFLYDREKSLIPFIPLMCFQVGLWMASMKTGRKGILPAFFLLILYFAVTLKINRDNYLYILDLLLLMGAVLLYYKWKPDVRMIMIPSICIMIIAAGVSWKNSDAGLNWSDLELDKRKEIAQIIDKTVQEDDSLYRMEYYGKNSDNFKNMNRIFHIDQNITSLYSSAFNTCYSNFRNEIFDVEKGYRNTLMENPSENVIFRKLMGVKYVISEEKPVGYEEAGINTDESSEGLNLYKDENALPLVYGISELISSQTYEQLEFPYSQLVFLQYAVAGENEESVSAVNPEDTLVESVRKLDFTDQIEGSPQGEIRVELPESDKEQILFVRFHVKNRKNKDVLIKVGTASNNLCSKNHIYYNGNTVFTYAVGINAGQKDVVFDFGEGDYTVTDSQIYLAPLYTGKADRQSFDSSNESDSKSCRKTSQVLSGSIHMKKDGYLITSIPHDENFIILVDGEKCDAEVVNEGFTGVKLEKGRHEIVIYYAAPGKKAGVILTVCGIFIAGGYLVRRRMRK